MKNNIYLSISKRDLVVLGCLVFHVTWYMCDCCLDLTSHASVLFLKRKSDLALCILGKMREQP